MLARIFDAFVNTAIALVVLALLLGGASLILVHFGPNAVIAIILFATIFGFFYVISDAR
jgi:hypothetical protein